jgi:hypothetical protein
MIRGLTQTAILLALALLATSCGLQGQFGFRKSGEDTYRRIDARPEFAADEQIEWIFVFKKISGERDIGVVYQKKELVWVEVFTQTARVDKMAKVVYGTIKNLAPGEYQIIITDVKDDNRLIDSRDFVIYENDEEE